MKRNPLEWIVFGLGSALTLGVVAYLAAAAVRGDGEVRLQATVAQVVAVRAGLELTVRVENTGDAAALDVDAEACDAAGTCSSFRLDQVPVGATAERIARFDSGEEPFRARILGWRRGG